MKMRKSIAVCGVATLLMLGLVAAGTAQADTILSGLSGTLSGVDSNTVRDDGDGNHDYAIDRTLANTFDLSDGSSPVSITGTVDVTGLTSGSYLQIGLVDKEQADLSLDGYDHSGYMFNNSAIATFYAGTRNYARLADNNDLYSDQLFNPLGTTVGVFDFTLDISSDGTMGLTLHGDSDDSTTYTYGTRNWWDGDPFWSGGELENGAYLVAQLWIDTDDMTNPVNAEYDITGTQAAGTPVPEPASMALLGMGLVGLVATRSKKKVA